MIYFVMDDGDMMLSWIKDGVNVKVVGCVYMSCSDGEFVVVFKVFVFEMFSIYDMLFCEVWECNIKEGILIDFVCFD